MHSTARRLLARFSRAGLVVVLSGIIVCWCGAATECKELPWLGLMPRSCRPHQVSAFSQVHSPLAGALLSIWISIRAVCGRLLRLFSRQGSTVGAKTIAEGEVSGEVARGERLTLFKRPPRNGRYVE